MNALRISYSDKKVIEYNLKDELSHDFFKTINLVPEKVLTFHLDTGVLVLPPIIWSQCIIEFFDKPVVQSENKIKMGPVIDQVA